MSNAIRYEPRCASEPKSGSSVLVGDGFTANAHPAISWPTGQFQDHRIGGQTSTGLKTTGNWMRFAAVSAMDVRAAPFAPLRNQPHDWRWDTPFAPADVPENRWTSGVNKLMSHILFVPARSRGSVMDFPRRNCDSPERNGLGGKIRMSEQSP